MIKRVILDHKIDFSASYVVGDSGSEGKAKSALVQTEEGVLTTFQKIYLAQWLGSWSK